MVNITIVKKISSIINQSQLSKRLFSGVSWTLIGSVIGKFLQLISFIIVARILGKEEYGQIGIIRSTLSMFLMFSTLGMSITASRYISLYRNTDPYKALKVYKFTHNTVIIFGFIIGLLLFIFSGLIADKSLHNINLSGSLKICAIVLFFISLTSAQTGALNGFENFKALGIHSVINGLAQTILLIVGAYYFGINGVIVALGISAAILYIQYRYSLKNNLNSLKLAPKTEDKQFNNISIFVKFSLPAVLSGLVTVPILWWAKTYLIRNTGFGEMAIYDVAEQWYFMLLFIPNSLSSIILPMLTNMTTEGTKAQYSKLIKLNLIINISITLIIAIFIALFTPLIYSFYGKGFTNNAPLLILLVTAVICATNNVLGQVIASKGKMWLGLGVNSLWGIWLVLFSLLFIGKYSLGAVGLAYAMLVSYLLHSIAQTIVAKNVKFNANT
jgi:O-antigen/teichoic acid export membrane protein